jgi:hypothetical protein
MKLFASGRPVDPGWVVSMSTERSNAAAGLARAAFVVVGGFSSVASAAKQVHRRIP